MCLPVVIPHFSLYHHLISGQSVLTVPLSYNSTPTGTKTFGEGEGKDYILGAQLLCSPKPCTSFPSPQHNPYQSSEGEPNLPAANSQVQDESLWPEVRASQAQHPKLGDCVSFKHQTINRAKSQENTQKNNHHLPCNPLLRLPPPTRTFQHLQISTLEVSLLHYSAAISSFSGIQENSQTI